MCGEDEYYFTTIESAVEFIQNLGSNYKTDLKLSDSDQQRFERRINGQTEVQPTLSLDEMLTQSFDQAFEECKA